LPNICSCKSSKTIKCFNYCTRHESITASIDSWYCQLSSTLTSLAIQYIPSLKPKVLKHWWNDEASSFKIMAVEFLNNLALMGKRSSGLEFDLMKKNKKEYKCYIAKLKCDNSRNISDSLFQNLASKDNKSCWKTWKAKINPTKPIARCIDSLISELDIASSFASTFASNCFPIFPSPMPNLIFK